MLLVENHNHDPSWNLAFQERLFHLAGASGQSFVMLWQNGPSVIVGRYQNSYEEVDQEAARAASVKVVRRSTGGGAVYHDLGNMNYSLGVAEKNLANLDFKALALPILEVLRELGVPAELSGRNDLTVGGLKFSGTAQMASPGAVLYHGTLMYDVDLDILARILKVKPDKIESKGVKSVKSRVTNLKGHLPAGADLATIARKLSDKLGRRRYEATKEDMAAAAEIMSLKYGSWDWNWGQSPDFTVRREKRYPWGQLSLNLKVSEGRIMLARVFGDFFGADLTEFEAGLTGLYYGSPQMEERILRLGSLIEGASESDLRALPAA